MMSNAHKDYENWIRPKARFDYRIKTTDMMMMSSGCAWVANLLDPSRDVVGTVENDGDGGADLFHFKNRDAEKKFDAAVVLSYGTCDREAASGYMQEIEEDES
tara:strand:- start:3419 stop:3727 length:309 start_codon:yes stop_codon:yes gene_type:complete